GVRVEPEDLERTPYQIDRADANERDAVTGARGDVVPLDRQVAHLRADREARVVRKVRQAAEARAFRRREWRLRMRAEELVSAVTPELVRRARIAGQSSADVDVQIGDAAAPVEERDVLLAHRTAHAPLAKR